MPHYNYSKTFTAGGKVTEPEELEMPCHWGTLCDVTISFPAGCRGYCHVHIDDGLHQVFPTNPEEDYALDDWTLPIRGEYEILPSTRKLYLRGYNTGDFPHTITVGFRIKLPERLTPLEEALFRLVAILERMLGLR